MARQLISQHSSCPHRLLDVRDGSPWARFGVENLGTDVCPVAANVSPSCISTASELLSEFYYCITLNKGYLKVIIQENRFPKVTNDQLSILAKE